MKSVSRFEANLLRVLRFLLGREPAARAWSLLEQRLPAPTCLSRPAIELVKDHLAKGCVAILARRVLRPNGTVRLGGGSPGPGRASRPPPPGPPP